MGYSQIVRHYEECFAQHGDSAKGVDWTQEDQVEKRYQVMLELINYREKTFNLSGLSVNLLDYGCGLSHLYGYIKRQALDAIHYTGLEISEKFYQASVDKYPQNKYLLLDILQDPSPKLDEEFDYIVMNGVFTEKRDLTYQEMFDYFKSVIRKVYPLATKGLAFNLMSKQVDWEKDFLFHVPLDDLANFLVKELTRNFVIRNDYGLYEYTVYVYC